MLKIAIAGAGFAGLSSAILLARLGHQVTVYEKFPKPQAVGAGILIQPSGLAAMQTLGIRDAILQQGAKVTHLYGVNHRQRPVVNVRYADWNPASFGVGLHRGILFHSLWQTALEAGVQMRLGEEIKELAALQNQYDLTVVADGAKSQLRGQTGLPYRASLYPWGAVWAVLEDPQRQFGETLWQWFRHAGQMLGLMPTGYAPDSQMPVVSLFWSLPASHLDAWKNQGLNAFKQQVLALNPACSALLDQITSVDQMTWARYYDVVMPRYHTQNTVVIGDAAHATSPQLGQGTNLALMDACALANCLGQTTDVTAALQAYNQQRQQHLHFYGQASRWLTPLFQSHGLVLPWLRDQFMNRTGQWPVVGPLTRETLVGVRQSWWPGDPIGKTRARRK